MTTPAISRRIRCCAAALLAIAVLLPARAGAQAVFDHLTCWKVKDSAPKAKYSADLIAALNGLPTRSGCMVSVPAKLLCQPTNKSNVQPPPPGAPAGADLTGELLACYKVKCPKGEVSLTVTDQFGSRPMTAKAPTVLCAPANLPTPCGNSAPACDGACTIPGTHCGPNGQGGCTCAFG